MDDSIFINRIPDTADYLPPKNQKRRDRKKSSQQENGVEEPETEMRGDPTDSPTPIDNPDHLGTRIDLEV